MAVTPNTTLRLLKVPIELDNKNQLTFKTKKEQETYFLSLPHLEISEISYQRKDSMIYFPAHIDSILQYNYVMYLNENYTDKWFFAFITRMEYENDYNTRVYITTDVFQTWQFDLNFKESFIEREMMNVDDDVPGANLLPESLETGEFKVSGTAEFDELEPVNIVAYSGDKIPITPSGMPIVDITQGGYTINGISSSVVFLLTENENFTYLMNALQHENYSDFIVSCFSVPKIAVKDFLIEENKLKGSNYNIYILQNGKDYMQTPTEKTLVSTPNNLDNYVPKNQKLRTYPFMYLGFNPANGGSKIFRYEDFKNGTPQFKIISEVNPNPAIIFIPENYRGSDGDSLSDIVNMGGYPTLSSRNDFFNSWLAQNSEIISLQMQQEQFNYEIGQVQNIASGVSGIISGGVSENYGEIASSGINTAINVYKSSVNHDFYIKNMMAQQEKQKMLPDKVSLSSSNTTLIGYSLNDKNIFTRYTIKKQFAERIDKYFDMYGYSTNTLKIPNLNNRPNWNYVKTIGINIIADIPQEDLQTIKNIFDNGVTLWHKPSTFLDYSQNNR